MKKITNYRLRALYIVFMTLFLLIYYYSNSLYNFDYGDYQITIFKYFKNNRQNSETKIITIDLNIIGVLIKAGVYVVSPFAIYLAMALWNKKPNE